MKFPIGGTARELLSGVRRFRAGIGEIPVPTVTVWMREDGLKQGETVFLRSLRLFAPKAPKCGAFNFVIIFRGQQREETVARFSKKDTGYMRRALELARQAEGRTNPNPMVGAVIVSPTGEIVGEGWHHRAGEPHAEVNALAQAGAAAAGATMFVTLEPCSHHGRTPPCTEAVIAAGLKRVVIAVEDPNPQVAGQGRKRIKAAGIKTQVGLLEEEARRMNEVFFRHIISDMPFVTVKYAMSLDGKIAAASGDSRWISGEESRRRVHELRDRSDAVLLGIGSVLADDPLLNTRLEGETAPRHPLRVIADPLLKLPLTSQIARTAHEYPTVVFCSTAAELNRAEALAETGIEVAITPGDENALDLKVLLHRLYAEKKVCSVLVEGGAAINAALIRQGLADKLYVFIAPKLIGGHTAPGPVADLGLQLVRDAALLDIEGYTACGEDILLTAYFRR